MKRVVRSTGLVKTTKVVVVNHVIRDEHGIDHEVRSRSKMYLSNRYSYLTACGRSIQGGRWKDRMPNCLECAMVPAEETW